MSEKPIIFFLDDSVEGRRDLKMQLRSLFEEEFEIVGLDLFPTMEQYLSSFQDLPVAGFFVDQNLDESGVVTDFSGLKLVSFLRVIYQKMPIYIVTGHPIQGELETEDAGDAEAIVAKTDLITDSPSSLKFKKQFLRRVKLYEEALSIDQRRFRELLGKKIRGYISDDESIEFETLQVARQLPTEVAELPEAKALQDQLSNIKDILVRIESIKLK